MTMHTPYQPSNTVTPETLRCFCADDNRFPLDDLFTDGTHTYATNGHICIRVPRIDSIDRSSTVATGLLWTDAAAIDCWQDLPISSGHPNPPPHAPESADDIQDWYYHVLLRDRSCYVNGYYIDMIARLLPGHIWIAKPKHRQLIYLTSSTGTWDGILMPMFPPTGMERQYRDHRQKYNAA